MRIIFEVWCERGGIHWCAAKHASEMMANVDAAARTGDGNMVHVVRRRVT